MLGSCGNDQRFDDISAGWCECLDGDRRASAQLKQRDRLRDSLFFVGIQAVRDPKGRRGCCQRGKLDDLDVERGSRWF